MSIILKKRVNNRIAMEIIDHQDDQFGIQIEQIVSKIDNAIRSQSKYDTEIEQLKQLIEKRLGLKVKFIVNSTLAATLPFYINKFAILLNPMWRGNVAIPEQDKVIKDAHDRKGFVDTKKAKVSGVFSDYENLLYINFAQLLGSYKLTSGEVTSVILHELGHDFYACEYADRLESVNQVLANIATEIMSSKKEKNITYVFKELQKINKDITAEEAEKILNGENRTIAGYLLFKHVVGSVTSQLKDSTYDKTAFEQLADNFASRFGYGRQLITSLDKLSDYFGNREKNLLWGSLGLILSSIRIVFTLALIISAITAGAIPAAIIYTIVLGINFLFSGEAYKDYTYDELKIRYKRIRNEYIDLIKNLDIPKDELKGILDNIYLVDSAINNTYQYRDLYSKLSNVLLSANRKANNSIKEQQLLEELAFNDLFLSSAQLRAL